MKSRTIITIFLLVVSVFLTSGFIYFRLLYPEILAYWNQQQATQIQESVERACNVNIEVNPDTISELPSWEKRYPISEGEILEISCSEVGRLSWECECNYKEVTP
jgi:hypothetical protein